MSSTKPSSTSDWEPPSPEELQALLPQYEISAILGRGGMGAVYRGRQVNLDRDVAIKLLPENLAEGEDELNFVARFKQEARSMAKLDHPAIISVHDFGETSAGQLYFVMEFIDGMDIHQYLHSHGGKLPQEQALNIVAHVLDALDYAHSHGIVHRDIKPANILLNQEGRVKIADFGLAKKFGEAVDPSAPMLTMSNVAVGTPDFVAPEALDPDATPDHRADLYAVGVMLYQMLTGRIPRGNYRTPSEMDAEIDPRLDAIVSKAMASDPDYRYPSAAAVRADLDEIFSRPFAKAEAGEESAAVAAVVPVTTSVKGKSGKSRGSPALIYGGVGLAAALVIGIVVMATRGGKELSESSADTLTVAAVEKTPEPEQAAPVPKPDAAPLEDTGAPPQAEEKPKRDPTSPKSSAAVAAETMSEPEPAPIAPKPIIAPTENVAVLPEPPAPKEAPGTKSNALATIPGLVPRLEAYLTARRSQTEDLAAKYQRGLEARFNQAADSGDLVLSKAFQEEKDRLAVLRKTLTEPVADPFATVEGAESLPDLTGDAPESLATLRAAWDGEYRKINDDLDGKLRQSLQVLEGELTRARDLENAGAVMAYREGLQGAADPASLTSQTGPTKPTEESGAAPAGIDPELARATKEAPFENSLGMKFVPVPGTDVLFCIHETRWRDYEEYAKKAKETVDGAWKGQTYDGFEIKRGGEDHPVTKVNWDDAHKFCAWLSEKEGKTYRLPTDREWSLAVGIGDKEDWKDDTTPETVFKVRDFFPWGDEWPPPAGVGNFSDASRQAKAPRDDGKYVEGGYDDGYPTTAPVMSFAANKIGLFDLGGNVLEWCEDWYSGEQKERVLRVGSWYSYFGRDSLHSSFRSRSTPGSRLNNCGFRIVLETGGQTPAPPAPAPPSAAAPKTLDPELARATKDAPFENSLGMKFVPVPGTDVLFCIHETRYRDYEEYAKKTKESVDSTWKGQSHFGYEIKRDGEDYPVTRVSWDDAQKFCAWLSEKEGKAYRLPTDREWSLAVGIGEAEDWDDDTTPETVFTPQNAFPWGDEWPPPAGAGNYRDESQRAKAPRDDRNYIDGYDDGYPTTAPVMSFDPNLFGLYDLGCSAAEWVEDWYSEQQSARVLRGGSWGASVPGSLLSSFRFRGSPGIRDHFNGFRVVLPVSESGR